MLGVVLAVIFGALYAYSSACGGYRAAARRGYRTVKLPGSPIRAVALTEGDLPPTRSPRAD